MSIKTNIDSLTYETRKHIAKKLQFQANIDNKYSRYTPKRWVYPYEIVEDYIYLPFTYAQTTLELDRPERKQFPSMNRTFQGQLNEVQVEIRQEAFNMLNKSGCCLLSLYTGAGKTIITIYLASRIKLKTAIIAHRLVLIDQWKEAIEEFCPNAKVQILESTDEIDDEADFYILNVVNTPKFSSIAFKHVGLCVLDEIHLLVSEVFSECLKFFSPRYLIGLSATPYRKDGLNVLFDLYFGKNRIHRELKQKHIVYKINTGIVPETKQNKDGGLDWSSVIKSQCENQQRNDFIVELAKHFKDKNILVLSKRVKQARYIAETLEEEKEYVTTLIGTEKEYDKEARILVGTTSKIGVGFNHPKLDTLILASDVADQRDRKNPEIEGYYIQILGRVFRRKDVVPVVFDLVDNFRSLKDHWNERKKVYENHGGEVKIFENEFPSFGFKSFLKNDI